MPKQTVCKVSELPVGERRIVDVKGRSIGVFNVHGEYYAIRNLCPHEGAPLCRGIVTGTTLPSQPGEYIWAKDGEIVRCPWHGWEFDITTGQSWFDPAKTRVRAYEVHVEGLPVPEEMGNYLPGPYTAETYPVSVDERQFVVVDVPG